ncbi:trypsin inhibitor 1B-like [Prosopis cineraria]|uniref:trypsin inhibitor 1B-like n=1 Tax=Prosopis cineraria TaxID=364024 RepID=UPI00240F689D|nr:trypsin inhibitor 1B-like [Prosopis cineraria]
MAKTTILVIFFLLFAFTSSKFASASADMVLDAEGGMLKNGGSYHIVPALSGRVLRFHGFSASCGGIGLAAIGNETCPLTVVQKPSEETDGLPLIISSPARIAYIAEGLLLDIAFSAVPTCAPTLSKWTIVEEQPAGMSVKIRGYNNTVDGKFKIIKYQSLFSKLKFCPTGDPCGDLGLYYDESGNRHLVIVTDESPLAVLFKKVL